MERMLELAELENRQVLEVREAIDLATLVSDARTGLASLSHKKKVVYEVQLEECEGLYGDPFLLLQALANLLRNALTFSPTRGQISVTGQQQNQRYCIQILDQGPGIPDFATAKVFERFYSLPAPEVGKGTGLGLSFVSEVAALHGGEASLTNYADGGAVATLCLPLS